jgi:Tfp pilus assembly protein PilW
MTVFIALVALLLLLSIVMAAISIYLDATASNDWE